MLLRAVPIKKGKPMIRKLATLSAVSFALAAPVFAEEVEISGNVTLTTDYVWRGISQSNEDFAVQGGFDLALENGFYVGTWASNVDFQDEPQDTNLELDFYGGFAGEFANGIGWDVGAIAYLYPDTEDADLDFVEVYGGLSTELENGLGLGGYVYYDFDNQNVWIEGSAGYSFTDSFAADVSLGNYSFDGGGDYTAYSVGATYSAPVGLDFDLRFWGTDVDNVSIADERVVLSVSKSL